MASTSDFDTLTLLQMKFETTQFPCALLYSHFLDELICRWHKETRCSVGGLESAETQASDNIVSIKEDFTKDGDVVSAFALNGFNLSLLLKWVESIYAETCMLRLDCLLVIAATSTSMLADSQLDAKKMMAALIQRDSLHLLTTLLSTDHGAGDAVAKVIAELLCLSTVDVLEIGGRVVVDYLVDYLDIFVRTFKRLLHRQSDARVIAFWMGVKNSPNLSRMKKLKLFTSILVHSKKSLIFHG